MLGLAFNNRCFMGRYVEYFIKQLFLVALLIMPVSLLAGELLTTQKGLEKQIKDYRKLLQVEPKSEVVREGLADLAVATLLLMEKADELGNNKELQRLKELVRNKLPDTAWRIENKAVKKQTDAVLAAAVLYRYGLLVGQDRDKSCGYYEAIADQQSPYANYRSALCFVGLDSDKTVAYMTAAAHQGHAIAQEYLARVCLASKDWVCMVRWVKPAADKGRISALSLMAWAYVQGHGVDKDISMAVEYYERAAKGGDLLAENNLGQLFEEGLVVKKDLSKAVLHYRLAAEGGFAQGQYNLGRLYLFGIGVKKSERQAVEWLTKSSLQGMSEAEQLLELMSGAFNKFEKKRVNVK